MYCGVPKNRAAFSASRPNASLPNAPCNCARRCSSSEAASATRPTGSTDAGRYLDLAARSSRSSPSEGSGDIVRIRPASVRQSFATDNEDQRTPANAPGLRWTEHFSAAHTGELELVAQERVGLLPVGSPDDPAVRREDVEGRVGL